jgi:hypothetical protein
MSAGPILSRVGPDKSEPGVPDISIERAWLEAQIAALRSLEARVAGLEGKRLEYEARLRVGRPWEVEEISRSAWYRRRRSVV